MSWLRCIWPTVLVLMPTSTVAYYVPGTYPQEYRKGEVLQAQVSSLSSVYTQLPYDYYTMPFCKPPAGKLQAARSPNLGSRLQGVTFQSSPYSFTMMVPEQDKVACQAGYREPLTRSEAEILTQRIRESYSVNIILDNLPALNSSDYDLQQGVRDNFVFPGYELGYIGRDGNAYVYNHLSFKVLVHASNGKYSQEARKRMTEELAESIDARKLLQQQGMAAVPAARSFRGSEVTDEMAAEAVSDEALARPGGEGASVASDALPRGTMGDTSPDSLLWVVVGLEVTPCSVSGAAASVIAGLSCWRYFGDAYPGQQVVEGASIAYTYNVVFSEAPIDWPSRWDGYMGVPDSEIPWFSHRRQASQREKLARSRVWDTVERMFLAGNSCLMIVALMAYGLARLVRDVAVATQSARALPVQLQPSGLKEASDPSTAQCISPGELNPTSLTKGATDPSSAQCVSPPELGPTGLMKEATDPPSAQCVSPVESAPTGLKQASNPSTAQSVSPADLGPTGLKQANDPSTAQCVSPAESGPGGLMKGASDSSSVQCVSPADSGPSGPKQEAGWELASTVLFHPPPAAKTLAALVGSGVHILCTTGCTLVLAALGFCSSASWGSLLTTLLVLYVLAAPAGGLAGVYVLGVMQRSYDGWVSVCKQVSALFTGVAMLALTIVNVAVRPTGSTLAIPVSTYLALLLTWLLVITPITFLGGRTATQLPILVRPQTTIFIPHPRPWARLPMAAWLQTHRLATAAWVQYFSCSMVMFAAVYGELAFAMMSAWLGFYYSPFGFALLTGCLTAIIGAQTTALCTYNRLRVGDYGWWWGSFHRGASVTLPVAICVLRPSSVVLHLLIGFLPAFMNLCYMSVILLGVYLAMGAIGVLSSYAFFYGILFHEGKAGCRAIA